MRSKVYLLTVLIALVISLVSLPALAQRALSGTGNINGTVSDETGGVVPGASITVLNRATGTHSETVTDDLGFYTVQGLNIQGLYDVSAALTGFKTAVVSGQRVTSDTTLTVNIVLAVGDVTETVTVSGQAQLIKTTDTTVAHQHDAEILEVLPVQMDFFVRQSMTLINTLPGVIYRPTWDGNKGTIHGVGDEGLRNPIGYNTDGHQSSINWHHGLRDETGPAPELLQEFRIETNQDAEKGFNSGVSVEMITKSGTNDFHGSLFWFHRNDWLDARRWTASERAPQKQNEAGFVLGGPIVKDKVWFMMNWSSYEHKRFFRGQIDTVQTDLMRAGNFTEILGPVIGTDPLGREVRQGMIYDPLTTREVGGQFVRDPFPGNIVPSDRIGSVARHLMTAYPGPNIPGAGLSNNYNGEGGFFFDTDKTYLKTDIEHNQHKFTVGYEDTPNNKLTFADPANTLRSSCSRDSWVPPSHQSSVDALTESALEHPGRYQPDYLRRRKNAAGQQPLSGWLRPGGLDVRYSADKNSECRGRRLRRPQRFECPPPVNGSHLHGHVLAQGQPQCEIRGPAQYLGREVHRRETHGRQLFLPESAHRLSCFCRLHVLCKDG